MKMNEYIKTLPLDTIRQEELQKKITRDRNIFYWCGLCFGAAIAHIMMVVA